MSNINLQMWETRDIFIHRILFQDCIANVNLIIIFSPFPFVDSFSLFLSIAPFYLYNKFSPTRHIQKSLEIDLPTPNPHLPTPLSLPTICVQERTGSQVYYRAGLAEQLVERYRHGRTALAADHRDKGQQQFDSLTRDFIDTRLSSQQ